MDDITVKLGLDTNPFVAALRGVNGLVKKYATGLGALTGLGSLAAFAKSTVDYGSHLVDLSEKTGVSTDALQTFGFAAQLSGASVDDVAMAIKKLTQAQAQAIGGNKDMTASFGQLGINLSKVRSLNPEALFRAIAEEVERSGLAFSKFDDFLKILGKDANALLPAMKDGFASVANGVEKFTAEQLKDMDKMGDAWAIHWNNFKVTGLKAGYEVGKLLEKQIIAVMVLLQAPFAMNIDVRKRTPTNETEIRTEGNLIQEELLLKLMGAEDDTLESMLNKLQKAKDRRADSYALEQKTAAEHAKQTDLLNDEISKGLQLAGSFDAANEILFKRRILLNEEIGLINKEGDRLEKQIELRKVENDIVEMGIRAKEQADKNAAKSDNLAKENLRELVRIQSVRDEMRNKANERMTAHNANVVAVRDLVQAQGDQSRFSLQELAGMRGRGAFGAETQGARDVITLERWAKESRQLNLPGRADELQSRADKLKGTLTNLTSGERNPFAALQENTKSTADAVKAIDSKSTVGGFRVQEVGGNHR